MISERAYVMSSRMYFIVVVTDISRNIRSNNKKAILKFQKLQLKKQPLVDGNKMLPGIKKIRLLLNSL